MLKMENRKDLISASKMRCRRHGLDPDRPQVVRRLSEKDLARRIRECHFLISAAVPYMELMTETFKVCGSVLALADEEANIIRLTGPDSALDAARKKGLCLGASLREEHAGTTAASLTLRHHVPFYMSGDEYYLKIFRGGSCYAAPVGAAGRVIGLVIIVHPYKIGHPHTFTLAQTVAQLISREYREMTEGDLVRSLGDCLSSALVLTAEDGEIRYVNPSAQRLLRVQAGEKITGYLDGIGNRSGELSNEIVHAARIQRPILVTRKLHDGGHLYLIEPVGEIPDQAGKNPRTRAPYSFDDIVGLAGMKKKARHLAGRRVNILVLGESGTGKELFASAIHNADLNPTGRFVPVNCSAIPATLFETELFGHTKGAFTDARHDRTGKIEHAQQGTLFFDEIGDLPPDVQGKLLRVLETRRVCPLGGNEEKEINVRFIFATNRDLMEMVEKGRFREDLYYRISPVTIRIPPLRERKEEIPELVGHFLEKAQRLDKKFTTGITDEALARLVEYHYPGNVRELEGIVRNAYLTCAGEWIGPGDLNLDQVPVLTLKEKLEDYRRALIMEKLAENGGDVRQTAAELKISRRSIYRYINDKEAT